MTKRDFELIARVMRGARHPLQEHKWNEPLNAAAEAFAEELLATNPRFDRARFLKACGVEA